ncbi:MAG: hypothetical protein IPK65_10875 [Gammaproteobacteria bacterium]|nr:hypothetical protein [Gammaproteobacteria bacterium]
MHFSPGPSDISMDIFEFTDSSGLSGHLRDAGVKPWSAVVQAEDPDDSSYFTIEGMRGEEYSVGIFIFMLIGVLVFAGVILRFVWMAKKESGLKTGEKIMFLWIILGTIVAVIFGGLQLLHGRLF